MIHCHRIINSVFNSCTYVLHEERATGAVIVDCGDAQPIIEYLVSKKFTLKAILFTHSHFDHIFGLHKVVSAFPSAEIYTSKNGIEGLRNPKLNISHLHKEDPDFIFESDCVRVLTEGDVLELDGLKIKVLSTEGHDWSCLSYICGEYIFTGDSYIPGVKVITNWPKSNKSIANESLERLRKFEADGLQVKSGHYVAVR